MDKHIHCRAQWLEWQPRHRADKSLQATTDLEIARAAQGPGPLCPRCDGRRLVVRNTPALLGPGPQAVLLHCFVKVPENGGHFISIWIGCYSPVDYLPVRLASGGDGGRSGDLRHGHKPQARRPGSWGRGWRLIVMIVVIFWNRKSLILINLCSYSTTVSTRTPTTGSPIILFHLQFVSDISCYTVHLYNQI